MTAGESIRAAREALGWSQSDLAREAGIGQDTVSDIERGKTNPSRGSLDKIRAVLDFEEPDVTTTESEPREFTKDEPPRARKAGAAKKAAPTDGAKKTATKKAAPAKAKKPAAKKTAAAE